MSGGAISAARARMTWSSPCSERRLLRARRFNARRVSGATSRMCTELIAQAYCYRSGLATAPAFPALSHGRCWVFRSGWLGPATQRRAPDRAAGRGLSDTVKVPRGWDGTSGTTATRGLAGTNSWARRLVPESCVGRPRTVAWYRRCSGRASDRRSRSNRRRVRSGQRERAGRPVPVKEVSNPPSLLPYSSLANATQGSQDGEPPDDQAQPRTSRVAGCPSAGAPG